MRVTVLGTGSQGNAILVEAGATRLLLDAGLSARTLRQRMRTAFGDAPRRLDAVLVTHAHADHAAHARSCASAFGAPLVATQSTRRALALPQSMPARELRRRDRFSVGELDVRTLPVPHDLPQVAVVVEHRGARAAIVTDLGHVPRDLVHHLDGCGAVLVESNHDETLLRGSAYPPEIQRRIGGARGHLSNAQCASLLERLGPETQTVVLLHLSDNNNEPALALQTAARALERRPRVRLEVAHSQRPLGIEVRPVPGQLELPLPSRVASGYDGRDG
jgi:phosphoribosyl 1,2-cyclic phosphodiesterase